MFKKIFKYKYQDIKKISPKNHPLKISRCRYENSIIPGIQLIIEKISKRKTNKELFLFLSND
jgi:hypothetical protein